MVRTFEEEKKFKLKGAWHFIPDFKLAQYILLWYVFDIFKGF